MTRVFRSKRQGITTIEVVFGDYPEDWEIAERWQRVEAALEAARGEGYTVKETRNVNNTFRSYEVETPAKWLNL